MVLEIARMGGSGTRRAACAGCTGAYGARRVGLAPVWSVQILVVKLAASRLMWTSSGLESRRLTRSSAPWQSYSRGMIVA